jgi:transcriptional regulator with XRE-family HTH domain
MDILDSLIQIRRDQKVDQKHLKSFLDVNGTTLSRYESKQRQIPFKILIKYAEYFGYEIRLLKK